MVRSQQSLQPLMDTRHLSWRCSCFLWQLLLILLPILQLLIAISTWTCLSLTGQEQYGALKDLQIKREGEAEGFYSWNTMGFSWQTIHWDSRNYSLFCWRICWIMSYEVWRCPRTFKESSRKANRSFLYCWKDLPGPSIPGVSSMSDCDGEGKKASLPNMFYWRTCHSMAM